MKCIEDKKLSAYLDGELGEGEVVIIESHLKNCAECKKALDQLIAISNALDGYRSIEPGPYFAAQIKRRATEMPRTNVLRRATATAAIGIASSLALLLGGYAGQTLMTSDNDDDVANDNELIEYFDISLAEDKPDGSLGEFYESISEADEGGEL